MGNDHGTINTGKKSWQIL